MVKFIKNLFLYWRFKRAIRICKERNATRARNKCIVANICGKPYVINRTAFRYLRQKGVFSSDLKWSDVTARQVTSQTLKQWLS